MARDPNAGEVVRVNPIVEKLAATLFVHVNTASSAVMNVTSDYSRISAVLHFNTADAIRMDVAFVEITLRLHIFLPLSTLRHAYHAIFEAENAHISAVVYMTAFERRCCLILHPNAGQIITRDLALFVASFKGNVYLKITFITPTSCLFSDINAHILTVDHFAMLYRRISAGAFHAQCRADCKWDVFGIGKGIQSAYQRCCYGLCSDR